MKSLPERIPTWKIALGVLPGVVVVIGTAQRMLVWPNVTLIPPQVTLLGLLAWVALYAGASLREKRVPLWVLPGLSVTLPGGLRDAWMTLQWPVGVLPTTVELLEGMMLVGMVLWGARLAKRHGNSAAILLVIPATFWVLVGVMDPTYAWLVYWPDEQVAVALTETVILALPLVVLPVWVLRAKASRQVNWLVVGLGVLTLELSVAAGIVRAVGMVRRGVVNAPTLGKAIAYMLTTNQVLIVYAMLPVVGLLALYTWLGRRSVRGAGQAQA